MPVGTYELTVEAQGFNVSRQSGSGRFRRKANKVTTKELENFVQQGSDAAEYIKIMPGFGISNTTSNTANYTGQTIGINGNGGNQRFWVIPRLGGWSARTRTSGETAFFTPTLCCNLWSPQ